ncbi:cytochrome C [Geomonas limicola]|uniref:cytochrome C n=1 Tax=Geomonas limicola TaxID=2740186 RepID=UPI0016144D51|nr:cytochrome C [Geomonas limicola]
MNKRDAGIAVGVLLLLLVLAFGALRGRGQDTPFDEAHWGAYRGQLAGEGREALEKGCSECHSIKYLKHHPPKEQCLICHKLVKR